MPFDARAPASEATEAGARAAPSKPESPAPTSFRKLESLRGLAACMVAFHHSPLMVGAVAVSFSASSYLFVDFFFILSGFVMTHAYRERISRGLPFKAYALSRLGRLFPLHVFAHLLYASSVVGKWLLFSFGIGGSNPAEYVHVPSFWTNLFLLQGFGLHDYLYWNRPSWSISAELGAYVVFFVSTCTWDRRGRILPPLALSIALYAGLLLGDERRLDVTYDLGVARCLAGFYLGSALLRMHRAFGASLTLSGPARTWAEAACLGALAVSVSQAAKGNGYVVGAILSFAVTIRAFSSSSQGMLGALLENRWLRRLGLWSYSIYLLHLVCYETAANLVERGFGLDLSKGVGLLALPANAAILAVVIVLSRFTYEWIENPFRALVKARLEPAPLRSSAPPPRSSRSPSSGPPLAQL